MIGLLRGRAVSRTGEGEVIVDVAGVGYRVAVTPATAAALVVGGTAEEATLFVHTHVREDAIVLYGFVHDDERRCFEVLLGSHGVGPALALAIMGSLSPAALSTAVLEDDVETLCTVPGVGRKTAARLFIELKSRLELPDLSTPPVAAAAGRRTAGDAHVAGRSEGGTQRARVRARRDPGRGSTACATMSAWRRCCDWRSESWPRGEPTGPPGGAGGAEDETRTPCRRPGQPVDGEEELEEARSPAAHPGRVRRPGRTGRASRHRDPGGPSARPAGRPSPLRRAARAGQDVAGRDRRRRDAGGPAHHGRPGARRAPATSPR